MAKAKKLKIIPLGGLNEIGKNLTVFEYGKDIIVLDCGIAFPDEEMLGVDLVIPDFNYLIKNANKVRGLVLTHGHEDHIGAIPYLLKELNIPVKFIGVGEQIDDMKPFDSKEFAGALFEEN